jgi:hypothetical protein
MKRRKSKKLSETTPSKGKLPQKETISFDQPKEVRAIARERVGTVKPSHAIPPKTARKKPKHKKPPGEDANGA